MINLNRSQLVVCWIALLLISYFALVPAIDVDEKFKYESKDGWVWRRFNRDDELKSDSGTPYLISTTKDPDGTVGREYYYVGSYTDYSINTYRGVHAHERIILVIALNSFLLVYTLGRKKTLKTSDSKK